MIVVLFGILFVKSLSESKSDVGLYINFCANFVLLLIWSVAMALFKLSSSSKFVWGFACSHLNIPVLNYSYFCIRGVNQFCGLHLSKTLVWAITIVAVAIE